MSLFVNFLVHGDCTRVSFRFWHPTDSVSYSIFFNAKPPAVAPSEELVQPNHFLPPMSGPNTLFYNGSLAQGFSTAKQILEMFRQSRSHHRGGRRLRDALSRSTRTGSRRIAWKLLLSSLVLPSTRNIVPHLAGLERCSATSTCPPRPWVPRPAYRRKKLSKRPHTNIYIYIYIYIYMYRVLRYTVRFFFFFQKLAVSVALNGWLCWFRCPVAPSGARTHSLTKAE